MLDRLRDRLRGESAAADGDVPAPAGTEVNPHYTTEAPSAQNQLDLFHGEWTSAVPTPGEPTVSGPRDDLFDDPRIAWLLDQVGSLDGMRVLELGPLECGHTAMLEAAGCRDLVAVEGHRRAFLRCLVVKNLLGLRARLEYGDFVGFLREREERFDLVVASGVLYHMRDPLEVLDLLGRRSDRVFLWTHYYDPDVMARRPDVADRFAGSETLRHDGLEATGHRYEYREGASLATFCGGPHPTSVWVERGTILDALARRGLTEVEVAFDEPDRDHGPALALLATRPDAA